MSTPAPGGAVAGPSPGDLAFSVAALRRENEQQQAQLDELRQDVHLLLTEVGESFTAITRRLDASATATPASGRPPVPRGWRGLDAGQERQLWRDLRDWLTWLHGRFPLHGRIPACWWRHPAAVEHLTALHHAWVAAYEDPQAPPAAQAEWLDRRLPSALRGLAGWLPGSCLTGVHTDDDAARYGRAVDDPEQYRHLTGPG